MTSTNVSTSTPSKRTKPVRSMASREAIMFWICVSPWVIGFIVFTLGPMAYSLYLSFTDWNILTPPKWIGLDNYTYIFTQDPNFLVSVRVTAIYALVSIPLSLATALLLAILLNEANHMVGFFRTAFYVPTIVASVAAAILWSWILNPRFGPVNGLLGLIGIKGPNWFSDPKFALWGLIIMSVWGVGGMMLIFFAGLKGVPKHLYEAAELDGANLPMRFFNITLPMLSPVIFFNLVMAVIGSFQTFDAAYVISTARAGTLGGPIKSTLFYMLNLYREGFSNLNMGYASALAWILFIIVFILTMITVRSSALWVHSEVGRK